MKNLNEIASIISNKMQEIISDIPGDYKSVICPERIFNSDYAPKVEDFIKKSNSNYVGEYEAPLEMPYPKTLFLVFKLGQGQTNMAVTNMPISIQCLSEENDLQIAREILNRYVEEVNFKYLNGIVQTYFTPEVLSSSEEVYTGFRALYSQRGYIRVPEEGIAFVTNIYIENSNGEYFNLPFIHESDNYSAQPDAISFSGYDGRTMALNRQSTSTITINTYLWNYTQEQIDSVGEEQQRLFENINSFCKKVLKANRNMNQKFKIALVTNIVLNDEDIDSDTKYIIINSEKRLLQSESWYVLYNRSHGQDWGNLEPYSLSFTEAKEQEE